MKTIILIANFLGECLFQAVVSLMTGFLFFLLYVFFGAIPAIVIITVLSIFNLIFYSENIWRDIILNIIGIGILCLVFFTTISPSFKTDILLSYVGIFFYTFQFKLSKENAK